MGIQVCKFRIYEGRERDFIKMNTHDWPDFLGRSPDFGGTKIERNSEDSLVFLTIDEWASKIAFDGYIETNRDEWDKLCAKHAELYEFFENIGFYEK